MAGLISRYARLDSACDALESFLGVRPREDDDLFSTLSIRSAEAADTLALANLNAHLVDATPGIYLAIPFFPRCSNEQPLLILNQTSQAITYLGRRLYAYVSDDEGVTDFERDSSAFKDKIAACAVIAPGARLRVGDYSMRFDGDFVANYRIILMVKGDRVELRTEVTKLAGFLWEPGCTGLHLLEAPDG